LREDKEDKEEIRGSEQRTVNYCQVPQGAESLGNGDVIFLPETTSGVGNFGGG
jgi:hypothetical protein